MYKKIKFTIAILTLMVTSNVFADEGAPLMTEEEKIQIITIAAEAMGLNVDAKDPEILQAAEAFIVADAAKSYSFTKIHGVTLEFCENDVSLQSAMKNYKEKASNFINLGASYYQNGFDLQMGETNFKSTSKELTDSLNEMLESIRSELESSSEAELAKKCKESTEALNMLTSLYGG